MLVLVLCLVMQTTPGRITKVPRYEVCNETQTTSIIRAGIEHEMVFFIDAVKVQGAAQRLFPVRYQAIEVWIYPGSGSAVRRAYSANDMEPVCPTGSANAGMRPHVVLMPAIPTPGPYRIQGATVDRRREDGSLTELALGRQEFMPAFPVTVK